MTEPIWLKMRGRPDLKLRLHADGTIEGDPQEFLAEALSSGFGRGTDQVIIWLLCREAERQKKKPADEAG